MPVAAKNVADAWLVFFGLQLCAEVRSRQNTSRGGVALQMAKGHMYSKAPLAQWLERWSYEP